MAFVSLLLACLQIKGTVLIVAVYYKCRVVR